MAMVNQERVLSVAVGAAVVVLMVLAFLREVTDALVIRPTLAAER